MIRNTSHILRELVQDQTATFYELFNEAIQYKSKGNFNEAISRFSELYNTIIYLTIKNKVYIYPALQTKIELGKCYHELGEPDKAKEHFDSISQLLENLKNITVNERYLHYFRALNMIGNFYFNLKKFQKNSNYYYQQIIQTFKNLTDTFTTDPSTHFQLLYYVAVAYDISTTYDIRTNLALAIHNYQKAITVFPNIQQGQSTLTNLYLECHCNLSDIYYEKNLTALPNVETTIINTINLLQINHNPDSDNQHRQVKYHYFLGNFYHKEQKFPACKQQFSTILEITLGFDDKINIKDIPILTGVFGYLKHNFTDENESRIYHYCEKCLDTKILWEINEHHFICSLINTLGNEKIKLCIYFYKLCQFINDNWLTDKKLLNPNLKIAFSHGDFQQKFVGLLADLKSRILEHFRNQGQTIKASQVLTQQPLHRNTQQENGKDNEDSHTLG